MVLTNNILDFINSELNVAANNIFFTFCQYKLITLNFKRLYCMSNNLQYIQCSQKRFHKIVLLVAMIFKKYTCLFKTKEIEVYCKLKKNVLNNYNTHSRLQNVYVFL